MCTTPCTDPVPTIDPKGDADRPAAGGPGARRPSTGTSDAFAVGGFALLLYGGTVGTAAWVDGERAPSSTWYAFGGAITLWLLSDATAPRRAPSTNATATGWRTWRIGATPRQIAVGGSF